MKSVTIHGLDDDLVKLLKARAEADGTSVNRTVKRLLEQALGVRPNPADSHRADFEEFCGVWSAEERAEFDRNTAELRTVDEEDWA